MSCMQIQRHWEQRWHLFGGGGCSVKANKAKEHNGARREDAPDAKGCKGDQIAGSSKWEAGAQDIDDHHEVHRCDDCSQTSQAWGDYIRQGKDDISCLILWNLLSQSCSLWDWRCTVRSICKIACLC